MLGRRTGIGAYTQNLLAALATQPEAASGELELRVMTFSARGRHIAELPPGVRQVGPALPARWLRAAWQRMPFPPIELLAGRADVVHGTNFVSPPAHRSAGVVTIHDLTYELLPETVTPDVLAYRGLVRQALARGAWVVTPSEHVANQVREHYGLSANRVRATPLGVSDAWHEATPLSGEARARLGLPEHYLLFVGSLDPRKNLPVLVAAHEHARRANPQLPPLVLAGPAGRAEGLRSRDVLLTGWLTDVDLRATVAGCAGLVLPSLDEGFGLPVVEALACGRPVLASDIPALREVGGDQVVFAQPNPEALAEGLERLVAMPDGAAEQAARRSRAALFSWDHTARATLEVYREAQH